MRSTIASLVLPATLLVAGCVAQDPRRPEPVYQPTYPELSVREPLDEASLFHAGRRTYLFDDSRARQVGDVLTIRLEEQTTSSKSAGTNYRKSSDQNVAEPTLFGSMVDDLASQFDAERDFNGEAESDQSNSLQGTVSAVVADVLPNGLLVVQGEKWLNLNRGEEYLRISGLVRPEDIDGFNTVSSLRLADARIAYSGTGAFADSNRAGWLSRFFLSPLMPF
ncbi:MAG: flagellar basal body L-ring protein FlgH [Pseudomonadota bacterium]